MFKSVKTYDSRLRDLVGSTNRERRKVREDDTTDPSEVGLHNENIYDIWSICTDSLTRVLCITMHVRCIFYWLIFAMNIPVKVLKYIGSMFFY